MAWVTTPTPAAIKTQQATSVFEQLGLDVETIIGSSLIGFSSSRRNTNQQQN
jgi:antitoxin component of RelBE/YafQ-DinJ toxin-antitoxin module